MRKVYVDFWRFIAMIAVFFIHCVFPGNFGVGLRAFNAFAVPVFFMTSGYLCEASSKGRILKRIRKLGRVIILANIFYLIWDICYVIWQGKAVIVFLREVFSIKKWILFILVNESPFRGHLWFLGALLYCYIVLYFAKKYGLKKLFRFFWLIFVIGIFLQMVLSKFNPEKINLVVRNWALEGIPFFFVGYFYKEYRGRIIHFISGRALYMTIVAFLIYFLEIHYVGTDKVYYIMTIIISLLLFSVAVEADDDGGVVVKSLGRFYQKYGLTFYIIQVAVIKSFELLFLIQGGLFSWIKPLLILLITVVLSVLVFECCSWTDRGRII